MVKSELIKKILAKYPSLQPEEAERIVAIFFEQIANSLIRGGTAELRGLGSFFTKTRPARKGHNPRTQEVINIKQKTVPAFRTSKLLIQKLNKELGT